MSFLKMVAAVGFLCFLCLSRCSAADQGDESYLPLGPHYFGSISAGGGPLEYRELVLSTAPSLTESLGGTYRGFSVSFWNGNDLTNTGNRASEGLVAYSHKLPLFDVHGGLYWSSMSGAASYHSVGARFVGTSNCSKKTTIGLTFDQGFREHDHLVGLSGSRTVYQAGHIRVDFKLDATHLDHGSLSAKGVAGKVMVTNQLTLHSAVHFFWGGMGSSISRSDGKQTKGAIIAGATFTWSF